MSSSSSSPSSSPASPTRAWEHSVFLCFRGEDTREGIRSHTFRALDSSGIDTFIDEWLPKGRDISELHDRIGKSRVSVVIFAENFASSRWCLDELVKILECRERLVKILESLFEWMSLRHDPKKPPDTKSLFKWVSRWHDPQKQPGRISQGLTRQLSRHSSS